MEQEARMRAGVTRRGSLGLAMGALAASAARAAPATGPGWGAVDQLAAKVVADRLTPGLSLYAMQRGEPIFMKGYGLANLETGTPVGPGSVFRIGSVGKHIVAAGIMKLAEQGKLSIDDPLARFVPDFPNAKNISLRQMMSHTAGLGNYNDFPSLAELRRAARPDYSDEAMLELLRARNPVIAAPGTRWAYSNTGYTLLGLIIGQVSGQPYGEFLKRVFFDPLGLKRTAVDEAAVVVPGRVSGYTPNDAAPSGFDNASYVSMSFPNAAGSIRSTPEEICRWHLALMNGQALSAASLEAMLTPARLRDGSLPMSAAGPGGAPPRPIEYGLGLWLRTDNGRRSFNHSGGMQGFTSHIRSFPAERISLAYVANTDSLGGVRKLPEAMMMLMAEAEKVALR